MDKKYGGYTAAELREFIAHSDDSSATKHCYATTAADGWIFSHVSELREFTRALLAAAPQAPVADAARADEDAYVAKRLSEVLADIYLTIVGNDDPPAQGGNAIERVKQAAQVLRMEVDLHRAQATASTQQPARYRYVVIGYGESDYPQVEHADADSLLDAVLGMIYTRPSDAPDDIRDAYRSELADEDEWCARVWRTEFEIGGIVVYDTGPLVDVAASQAVATLTDEQIIDAIKSVCRLNEPSFTGAFERYRKETIAMGRAVERAVVAAQLSTDANAPLSTETVDNPVQSEHIDRAATRTRGGE